MLVLVSFGLVLLATILLVVGLLSDDGLTLIYFSIASSFTAAVVLYLAFRLARPRPEPDTAAPSPLADDIAPTEPEVAPAPEPVASPDPTAVLPAAPPEEPAAEAQPAPVPAADDDVWTADEHWEDGDEEWAAAGDFEVEFPIADYDDLKVGEIMPLLPQLYSDELDIVADRERQGKNRSTILDRLAELAETGTEADRLEAEAEAAAEPAPSEPAPAPASAPAPPAVSLRDDEFDDEGYLFPIADYDELSVAQIRPLLPQLEPDELEEVKEHEVAGQARKSLITEIDRLLSGEAAEVEEPREPTPAQAAARLPIDGYDELTVAQIRPQLTDLSETELRAVRDHESTNAGRKTILDEVDRRLDTEPAAAPAPEPAVKKTPARKATKKRAAKKTAATKRTAKKAGKTRARKAKAAKKKATRFPIANYDELTVAEIRPRLGDLSDRQLEQVRERELAGAGRKTILKDIDSKLS